MKESYAPVTEKTQTQIQILNWFSQTWVSATPQLI